MSVAVPPIAKLAEILADEPWLIVVPYSKVETASSFVVHTNDSLTEETDVADTPEMTGGVVSVGSSPSASAGAAGARTKDKVSKEAL